MFDLSVRLFQLADYSKQKNDIFERQGRGNLFDTKYCKCPGAAQPVLSVLFTRMAKAINLAPLALGSAFKTGTV